VANDGDAGGASDDARSVDEGVGLDPTRRPAKKPQRRRSRGHIGSYDASALFFYPLRRTERAHFARSTEPLWTPCAAPRYRLRLNVMRSMERSDSPTISSR